jgi:hypothetical protein
LSYQALARVLDKQPDEAEKACRQALKLFEKMVAEYPGVPSYQEGRAGTLWRIGELLANSRPEKAAEAYHQALVIYENLVAAFPEVSAYWNNLAHSFHLLVSLAQSRGPQEVASVCRDGLTRFTKLSGESSREPGIQRAFRRLLAFAK